ncbi:MAG: AlwI family type II restriction endonuclease, partial [bacterium]|nr:AlwI family type II restriction endonuclease [bacterium]
LQSDTIAEQQECFLRALAAYNIPSIIEESYKFLSFSPLKFVLQILLHLEKIGKESMIKFEEMSLVVQHRSPDNGFNNVVSELLSYRNERNKADKKRGFAWNWFKEIIGGNETKFRTSNDYADCNFRYLKATGLFQAKGRAITLVPEKRTLIELMVSGDEERRSDAAYVKNLWNGAELPTDDKLKTIDIIRDLARQLETHGEKPEIGNLGVQTAADLSQVRYRLEDQLRCFKELSFAREQSDLREKIADCMKSFINYKRSRVKVEFPAGVTFNVPRGEQPAYFEWIIWRAFLAIDSLENKPWEARKFNVDQDFLPLSHAPAGRPDMVFWFEEYILVVEVTLTSSSRQEAAEGEPVRRHVAEIAEKYEDTGKKIYCLFIALNIDNNTAETFKIGRWYKKDDTKLPLQIVPVTLDDFIRLFESDRLDPAKLKLLLTECRAVSNQDAPEWKKAISTEIRDSFT